jgi:hypothetical protein
MDIEIINMENKLIIDNFNNNLHTPKSTDSILDFYSKKYNNNYSIIYIAIVRNKNINRKIYLDKLYLNCLVYKIKTETIIKSLLILSDEGNLELFKYIYYKEHTRINLYNSMFENIFCKINDIQIISFLYDMKKIDIWNYLASKWHLYVFTNIENIVYDDSYIITLCKIVNNCNKINSNEIYTYCEQSLRLLILMLTVTNKTILLQQLLISFDKFCHIYAIYWEFICFDNIEKKYGLSDVKDIDIHNKMSQIYLKYNDMFIKKIVFDNETKRILLSKYNRKDKYFAKRLFYNKNIFYKLIVNKKYDEANIFYSITPFKIDEEYYYEYPDACDYFNKKNSEFKLKTKKCVIL